MTTIRPDAVVGTIACPKNESLLGITARLRSRVSASVATIVNSVAVEHKRTEITKLVYVAPSRNGTSREFFMTKSLSAGTYGIVYKFSTKDGKYHVALKILHDQRPEDIPLNIKAIPTTLECKVARTVHFLGGIVQVMELGSSSLWPVTATKSLADKFDAFSNETALCLFDAGLVCPDWKAENVAYFQSPTCDTFRVIDVDGVTFSAVLGFEYIATFSCAYMPKALYGATARTTFYTTACTAYAIELTKCMFRHPAVRFYVEKLTTLGGNSRIGATTIAATLQAYTSGTLADSAIALSVEPVRVLLERMAKIEKTVNTAPDDAVRRLMLLLGKHFCPRVPVIFVVDSPFVDLCSPQSSA